MQNSGSNPSAERVGPTQAQLLHALANKLLPIVVFSELALRQCQDEKVRKQLEKIHGAAGDARDIIQELKKQKMEATV